MDKKRDNKWMFKKLVDAENAQDKAKVLHAIWRVVEKNYVDTLVRTPVEPVTWINDEFPKSDPDSKPVRQLFI